MKVDLVTAEIGSTTTLVTLFGKLGSRNAAPIDQAEHFTTVREGDVTLGIERALKKLEEKHHEPINWEEFAATSSAAGGLRISVHGLVFDMTVRAAKEAALGAGGIIKHITAGKMQPQDLKEVAAVNPNIIVLAGGVDYGERETVEHNAQLFAQSDLAVPFVYAGNIAASERVRNILESAGKKVTLTENVYPRVDELNVHPLRALIQNIFAEHIIHAAGMEKIQSMVDFPVLPTPAAVMQTTELLSEMHGDCLSVDIGGATTDVDSVTDGNPELQELSISPEPRSKRTVEGDLGVFVNAKNVVQAMGQQIHQSFPNYKNLLASISPYPKTEMLERFAAHLGKFCLVSGLRRHAGRMRYLYGPLGRQKIIEGKDLTAVRCLFGTGGILSRSRFSREILLSTLNLSKLYRDNLLPGTEIKLYRDSSYIFAPIGLLCQLDRDSAIQVLQKNVEHLNP
ncbi:MAG TPA: GlmL-related ornithine degradation protein [Thermotogota bacterium]|nr:GlmL-related ornithine degradation protein [Thermotogota bacterium]HRW92736.1 GlmL-related ornithine degradation protein [Thermotogota bacterium]